MRRRLRSNSFDGIDFSLPHHYSLVNPAVDVTYINAANHSNECVDISNALASTTDDLDTIQMATSASEDTMNFVSFAMTEISIIEVSYE